MTQTTSFRIDDELGTQLDALATTLDRPKGWVIEQALRRYIEDEGWQIAAIQDALKTVQDGTGDLRTHEDVMARMAAKLKNNGIKT